MKINEIKKWGNGLTGRTDFIETFLFESPEQKESNTWLPLKNDILELSTIYQNKIQEIATNFFCLALINTTYFWLEKNNEPVIAMALEPRPYADTILMVGKNPEYKNKLPYASDFYIMVLKKLQRNLVASDKTLSYFGFKIWQRLFNEGYKISIYNTSTPGQTFQKINTKEELKQYYQIGHKFQQYRFILSETLQAQGEILPIFSVRKYRETNNLPLED